jgi:hypothetical protein
MLQINELFIGYEECREQLVLAVVGGYARG